MANNLDGKSTQLVILTVVECLGGGNDNGFSGVDAQWVEVFHIANRDTVVIAVAHHFILNLFPTLQTLLYQHLRREGKSLFGQDIEFLFVVGKAAAQSAQGVSSTDNHRIAQCGSSRAGLFYILAGFTLDGLYINFIKLLHKEFTVFSVHNGLNGRAENFHSIFFQHSRTVKLHTAVEGCLTPEAQQDAVGAFFLDDTLHKIGLYGQEIYLIGNALRSLDSCNVGIDEHRLDALFTQSFQCLRTGIVELAGLTYLQGSRPQQ